MLAQSVEEANNNMKLIEETIAEYRLSINKVKSNIIIYNKKEQPQQIEGIQVCESIKYLDVKITNKRNYFQKFKKERLNKVKQLATMTYNIVPGSRSRLLVGKILQRVSTANNTVCSKCCRLHTRRDRKATKN